MYIFDLETLSLVSNVALDFEHTISDEVAAQLLLVSDSFVVRTSYEDGKLANLKQYLLQ